MPIIYYKADLQDHYADKYDYFQYSVRATQKFNPQELIYIIGDTNPQFPNTIFVDRKSLANEYTAQLEEEYQHFSTNHQDFELQAILRWAYAESLMFNLDIQQAISLDVDVWLVRPTQEFRFSTPFATHLHTDWERLGDQPFAGACAHVMFINDVQLFQGVIAYWVWLLKDLKKNKKKSILGAWYESRLHMDTGITDMILWALYAKEHPEEFTSLKGFQSDGSLFDPRLGDSDGLIMNGDIKKIMRSGQYYFGMDATTGQIRRLNSLHLHGGLKELAKNLFEAFEKFK